MGTHSPCRPTGRQARRVEVTRAVTGHPVGGVCPFDLPEDLPVYFDVSLKPLGTVYPAGGSLNTSVRAPVERLFKLVGERWVDVCREPDEPTR